MAESTCIKCGSKRFEVVHANNLEGTSRSIIFVQCAECGAVISALDFVNLGLQALQMKENMHRFVDRVKSNFEGPTNRW